MLSGTKLGRYEIRQKIGSGGMGEVYLALDDQLARNVALKVLLPEFCCDAERVERFKMEAKAASALNHPNIITIYEINEYDGSIFIATEHVDGETLREKINAGELNALDAIKVAEQVADALAVAHEAHIVHRDIKPENVMIRRDRIVKILDFGLAKPLFEGKVGTEDETVRLVKTQPGIVMGSVRYMSPEQARGKDADERTDVWSLGVVLYEMLTGKNPFEGETVSDSLAALIHIEPAPLEDFPEELQRILRKALKKKADERYQSIKDFALDLRDLRSEAEPHSTDARLSQFAKTVSLRHHETSENETLIHHTVSAENETTARSKGWAKTREKTVETKTRRRLIPVAVIASAVILALCAWFILPKLLGRSTPVFMSIQASRLTESGTANIAEISPDGRFVAFVNRQEGKQSLVVKQIATGATAVIVQPSLMEFRQPSFSPDGEFIYYTLIDRGVGTLYRISTLGGESKKIALDIDSKVTFSPDGKRLAFIRHNPNEGGDTIFIAASDGTGLEPFLQSREVGFDGFVAADWSPDGEKMLVGSLNNRNDANQRLQFVTFGLKDKKTEVLGQRGWLGVKSFEWTRDGTGIVLAGKANTGDTSQVWHLSYPQGIARQITTDTSDYGSVSISASGESLVATRIDTISSLWSLNPQTRELKPLTSENKNLLGGAGISKTADGKILFAKSTGKEVDIFSIDEAGGNEKQLTSGSGYNVQPAASPDGKYLLFGSNRDGGAFSIWRANADGSGAVKLTNAQNATDGDLQITPDSKSVIFVRQTSDGGRAKMMRVSIEGGEAVQLLPESSDSELFPKISPDGKRIVFHTFHYDEKTSNFISVVKVVGFDGEKIDKTLQEIELNINPEYKWSPDGKSLTYINKSGVDNLWNISLNEPVRKETPLTEFNSASISNFVWSADGKKLFIMRSNFNSDLVLIKDGAKL